MPSPEVRSGGPGAPLGHAMGTEVAVTILESAQAAAGGCDCSGFWKGGGGGL